MQERTVVVTAGRGRLGRALTRRFREQGAVVVAVDRNTPSEDADLAFTADLTDEAAVTACFARIGEAVDRIDALVHTVGAWAGQPLTESSLAHWRTVMEVNLTSAFLCFREAVRLMQNRGGGRLIGIASGQGADRGAARQAAYSASKAGIIRLVEATAAEYAEHGLTAHAVAPSTILYGDEAPDARGVTADALADLCAYLIGPAGDAHNGATLRAYGTAY